MEHGGMVCAIENWSTWIKIAPIASLSTISITCFGLGLILGICSERSVTKSLSHTLAKISCGMPLSIQENSRVVPWLFHDYSFFHFIIPLLLHVVWFLVGIIKYSTEVATVFCFQGPDLLTYDTILLGMLVIWNVSNHLQFNIVS